jgi:serine/threonine-protein kinase RsbW
MTKESQSNGLQKLQFEVASALDEIPNATKRVFDFFKDLNLDESDRFDLRLSFEEILINAMKHGNAMKREVPVRITASYDLTELRIQVQDKGKGFDVAKVKDPTNEDNIEAYSGRGVYLVKHLMDRLEYDPNNHAVAISKNRKNKKS